jgi:putative ABC transport system substrate-binding protein
MVNTELSSKRIELLKEIAPRITRIAVFTDPTMGPQGLPETAAAARALGLELQVLDLTGAAIEHGFAEAERGQAPALLMPKRLELLSELVPRAGVIALLVNPNTPSAGRMIRDVQEAARAKGMQLQILKAGAEGGTDTAFASLVQLGVGALVVGADPFFNSRCEQLVALASRHAIPAIYEWREFAAAGGLISYGPSLTVVNRQAGIYAAKILKGAKPADLPVEQPTKFELVVNLNTAKALGLTVPESILARADEVIE